MNAKLIMEVLSGIRGELRPPGGASWFEHSSRDLRRALEVAIVLEHRFAFFYWLRWHIGRSLHEPPPDLLTMDWHDDIGGTCDFKPATLTRLSPRDANELSVFC